MNRGIASLWAAALAITTVACFYVLRDLVDDVSATNAEGWWCLIGLPAAGAIWCTRQAALPDHHRDVAWRIRNAVGCLGLAAGATAVFVMSYVPTVIAGPGPVPMMWGIAVGFNLGLPALGLAVLTLIWGLVDWLRAGQRPGRAPSRT